MYLTWTVDEEIGVDFVLDEVLSMYIAQAAGVLAGLIIPSGAVKAWHCVFGRFDLAALCVCHTLNVCLWFGKAR